MDTKISKDAQIHLYEKIMDTLIEGIFITNEQGRILWLNQVVCDSLGGLNREDVIGRKENEVWADAEMCTLNEVELANFPVNGNRYFYYPKHDKKNCIMMRSCIYSDDVAQKFIYTSGYYLDFIKHQLVDVLEYQQRLLNKQGKSSNETTFTFDDFIYKSPACKTLIEKAHIVAQKDSPVLIYGETGTGKEILAQGIHNASSYREGKFVAVNCAAIPENLLESILFGSSKGAYTGATDKKGLLEEAENGTLFLDEINSMPLVIQGKLLRVLQEKRFNRVGNLQRINTKCRVISATNKDPWALVKEGALREDLFFRLSTVVLPIPPLRKRREDIPLLIRYFIEQINQEYHADFEDVDEQCLAIFTRYNWPGNVRELQHCVEYMMNFASGNKILGVQDMPPYLLELVQKGNPDYFMGSTVEGSLPQLMEYYESTIINTALKKNNGNISETARQLGVPRETLYYKMKKLNAKA